MSAITLTPEVEVALNEVAKAYNLNRKVRNDWARTAVLIFCEAVIRDGKITWPVACDLRAETKEETFARLACL